MDERQPVARGAEGVDIGDGRLGLAPFRLLLRDRRLAGIPKVLETPKDPEPAADRRNLARLRRLRRLTGTSSPRRGGRGR